MSQRARGRNGHHGPAERCQHGPSATCEQCRERVCALADARRGDRMRILDIGDAGARMHAIRFGMQEGATVDCVTRVPAGPIVLKSGRQEIAVGRGLARRITVLREEAAR